MTEKIKFTFTITNTYTIILDKDEYVDDDGHIQEELLEEVCYDSVDRNIASLQDTEFSYIDKDILNNE
jgi:hypothetical protein